jgi:hypothetical protein
VKHRLAEPWPTVDREHLAAVLLRTWHEHPDGGPVTTDRWLAVADAAIRELDQETTR